MEKNNNLSLSFQIHDSNMHPNEITKLIDLTPTEMYVKNDTFYIGPEHNKIKREHTSNFWEYRLAFTLDETTWSQNIINRFILEVIGPKKDVIKMLPSSCKMNFFIGINYYNTLNPTFHFNSEDLRLLGTLGIDIDIDQYCWRDSPVERKVSK